MAIRKKERQLVFDKSNGFCWYCGEVLTKGWHADHLEPIRRFKGVKITDNGVESFNTCDNPHLDTLDNMVPACKRCNLFKGVWSLEEFRNEISYQVERAREYSVNFRTAERFGMVKVVDKPIIFWFETRGK